MNPTASAHFERAPFFFTTAPARLAGIMMTEGSME